MPVSATLAEGYAANLLADEGAFSWLGRALQSAAQDDNGNDSTLICFI